MSQSAESWFLCWENKWIQKCIQTFANIQGTTWCELTETGFLVLSWGTVLQALCSSSRWSHTVSQMLKYRLWGGPSTTHSVCSIVCFSIQAWLYCGKVWDHCHAKIYHSSVFPTCFPFIEASSTETISDEVSVDETKDQTDLSDPASGLCWIVFSCYLQTWHSDTFHHLQIFFSPATSYFVLYLPSLVRFLTDTIYTMLRSL